jgi:tetratricopeptide (TPR) repeat protein
VAPAAYDSYIRGRFYFDKQTRVGYEHACQYFEEAIAQDRAFALAHAALSECTWQLGSYEVIPLADATRRARNAALEALKLDADLSEAHTALGAVLLFGEWDWAGAERELTRAIDLNPSNANARRTYSAYLWAIGRKADRLAELQRAKELDPFNPGIRSILGWTHLWAGHADLAEAEFSDTLKLDPNTPLAHRGLGEVYASRRQADQALAEWRLALLQSSSEGGPAAVDEQRQIYRTKGLDAAQRFFWELDLRRDLALARQGRDMSCDLGVDYSRVGEKDKALHWMEIGVSRRCRRMMDLKSSPYFDPLRDEPRFQALLRQLNLPH